MRRLYPCRVLPSSAYARLQAAAVLRTERGDVAGAARAMREAGIVRKFQRAGELPQQRASAVLQELGDDGGRIAARWSYLPDLAGSATPSTSQPFSLTLGDRSDHKHPRIAVAYRDVRFRPDGSLVLPVAPTSRGVAGASVRELLRLAHRWRGQSGPKVDRYQAASRKVWDLLDEAPRFLSEDSLRQPGKAPVKGFAPVSWGLSDADRTGPSPSEAEERLRYHGATWHGQFGTALLDLADAADQVEAGQGEPARGAAQLTLTQIQGRHRPGETAPALPTAVDYWLGPGTWEKNVPPAAAQGAGWLALLALLALISSQKGKR